MRNVCVLEQATGMEWLLAQFDSEYRAESAGVFHVGFESFSLAAYGSNENGGRHDALYRGSRGSRAGYEQGS